MENNHYRKEDTVYCSSDGKIRICLDDKSINYIDFTDRSVANKFIKDKRVKATVGLSGKKSGKACMRIYRDEDDGVEVITFTEKGTKLKKRDIIVIEGIILDKNNIQLTKNKGDIVIVFGEKGVYRRRDKTSPTNERFYIAR